uniref:TBC1 domain family member 30 n=1 Tax=Dendroctonus ponderosae TaxID=77166 RepID=A0AAR5QFC8_DENPD
MSGFLSSFKKAGGDALKSSSASEPANMRFTIQPAPGESGFSQWVAAMKMVAQLPGGIPAEFRRRLWLTMAERHLDSQDIDWSETEKFCFSEWSHPTDAELGIQIVKDLHRTGCSLFCGEDGQENQALLKKVLLAYARWNKAVGYCQGFNMLAALILQVTDRCESDALKLMIYLIEGVLPDSYFADSLRGLSVDMAVFRELLRSKLPRLSKHLDVLQNAAKDGSRSYEPPLTNVFTMQWFLTLFCNCLPHPTVLRVWDLIFLEGNEVLLRTAVAIWQVLAQRILSVRTADEFYCMMGALTRELLESNLIDANTLIKAIVAIGPLKELKNLRDHYLYNITPWGTSMPRPVEKQISLHPKHNIPLDISALKKQYLKLKQRQRQAHVIFSSAISGQPAPAPALAINHLLVGKRALGSARRPAPPKGSIPPARQIHPSTIQWKDAEKQSSSSSSSDTELCDDDVQSSSEEEAKPPSQSQLTDNPSPGDISLKKCDNTEGSAASVANSLRASPVKLMSDSEDESAEFEHFLADRVKYLKENNSESGPGNVSASSHSRRNSELALQIIQENSMILRRMMQCQSRLSPSPPLYFKDEAEGELNPAETVTDLPAQKQDTVCSQSGEAENFPENPQINSRFHNILEKSKSLDERCNHLFYGEFLQQKSARLEGLHESKSETPLASASDDQLNPAGSKEKSLDNRKSGELIQQNVDLLKALAANKSKDPQQDRLQLSTRLIKENVDLLKSISSEKPCLSDSRDGNSEPFKADIRSVVAIFEDSASILANEALQPNGGRLEGAGVTLDCSSQLPPLNENDYTVPAHNSSVAEELSSVDLLSDYKAEDCGWNKEDDKDSAISVNGGQSSETATSHCLINFDDDLPLNEQQERYAISYESCDTPSTSFTFKSDHFSASTPSFSASRALSEEQLSLSKSPSHVFNPFPVALNSRQSKEVPLKLGLYRK